MIGITFPVFIGLTKMLRNLIFCRDIHYSKVFIIFAYIIDYVINTLCVTYRTAKEKTYS